MKEGDKVLVPRTGGTFSPGTILVINENGKALVEFAIGDTFQGQPAPEEIKNKTGIKVIDITNIRPLGVGA